MTASQSHNHYNFALQKYVLLQEQHQELCTHLSQIRPHPSPTTSNASSTSPSTSPTRFSPSPSSSSSSSSYSGFSPPQQTRSPTENRRCRGGTGGRDVVLDTIPDEDTLWAISAEETRLFDVNESIKRALTEMLNCEAVRGDAGMRMWVQTRLMEAEKELRSGRRRKGGLGRVV